MEGLAAVIPVAASLRASHLGGNEAREEKGRSRQRDRGGGRQGATMELVKRDPISSVHFRSCVLQSSIPNRQTLPQKVWSTYLHHYVRR